MSAERIGRARGRDGEIVDADALISAQSTVDHRSLLTKYLRYVSDQVRPGPFLADGWRALSAVEFTDAEWAELQRLAGEAR